jgi:hypothetical protein
MTYFSEYIEIDGTSLTTPAWIMNDITELYSGVSLRGQDSIVPYKQGSYARLKVIESKVVNIPMTFYGDKDLDGTPTADIRTGLRDNIDAFKELVVGQTYSGDNTGQRDLVVYLPDGSTRGSKISVQPDLQLTQVGVGVAKGVLTFTLMDGVLYDETPYIINNTFAADGNLTVTNHGSTITYFSGIFTPDLNCTGLRITNTTYPGDPFWELDIAGNTLGYTKIGTSFVDNLGYNVYKIDAGGVGIDQYVTTSNVIYWIPLLPGANVLSFDFFGGSPFPADIQFLTWSAYL